MPTVFIVKCTRSMFSLVRIEVAHFRMYLNFNSAQQNLLKRVPASYPTLKVLKNDYFSEYVPELSYHIAPKHRG